jgi:hypothetical protein
MGAGPETTGNRFEQLSLFDQQPQQQPLPTAEPVEGHAAPSHNHAISHAVIRGRRLDGTCHTHPATPTDRDEDPR